MNLMICDYDDDSYGFKAPLGLYMPHERQSLSFLHIHMARQFSSGAQRRLAFLPNPLRAAMFHSVFQAIVFALRLLGFVSLPVLLITVVLNEKVHRHLIFVNFLCTYVLYTSLMTFL